MNKEQIKKEIEDAYVGGGKYQLFKKITSNDISHIVDILWEYISESKKSETYQKEIDELKKRIAKLSEKSGQRIRCLSSLPNRRALIQLGPIKEEVLVSPSVNMDQIKLGTEGLVVGSGENRTLVEISSPKTHDGRLVKIIKKIDDLRAIIEIGGTERIANIAEWVKCNKGDEVRYDPETNIVLEIIEISSKQEENIFNDIPQFLFKDVKGLNQEKEYLTEKLIYPIVYRDQFNKYNIPSVRGALLHGPSGCGKTMLAGAIFNEIFELKNKNTNKPYSKSLSEGFFIINGPSLLSKWAGNTEEKIRNIFSKAREYSKKTGFPSVIFWDEIDSVAGRRKDNITYTPEKTIIPTLLSEIQGLNGIEGNVVLIGATNMPSLLDPALLRPGRLGDIILEIPPPNADGATAILNSKFRKVPKILDNLLKNNLVEDIVNHIYINQSPLATTKTKSGQVNAILRKNYISGAFFAQIGEELVRKSCLMEISQENELSKSQVIEIIDNLLLNQLGLLNSELKSGFKYDYKDYIIDVSLK